MATAAAPQITGTCLDQKLAPALQPGLLQIPIGGPRRLLCALLGLYEENTKPAVGEPLLLFNFFHIVPNLSSTLYLDGHL